MDVDVMVRDVFFIAKIMEAAKQTAAVIRVVERVGDVLAQRVIVDAEAFGSQAVRDLRRQHPRAVVVAYCPHLQAGLRKEVEEAGARVLSRKQLSDALAGGDFLRVFGASERRVME